MMAHTGIRPEHKHPEHKHEAGFSLIEVLAAVAVFAVVSAISVAMLGQALRSKDLTETAMDRLASAQRVAALLRADIGQTVMRPSRTPDGDTDPRVFAGAAEGAELVRRSSLDEREILVLTRTGWANPGDIQPRSTLQKVVWIYDGQTLFREISVYPDETLQTPRTRQIIAEGVTDLELSFLQGVEWIDQIRLSLGTEGTPNPPQAVRLRYQLSGLGQMEHIVLSPVGGRAS